MKTPERRQWRRSGVFVVNFEHVSRIAIVFPLLTLKSKCQLEGLTSGSILKPMNDTNSELVGYKVIVNSPMSAIMGNVLDYLI